MRILLVEDEKRLSNVIKKGFTEQGFAVDQAFDGGEGLFLATSESYDVVILDWMLPKMDGVVLCQELRKQNISVPVIMLTAKTQLQTLEVVTRTQIIEHTWDYNFDNLSNVVDVFIAGLRKKIDNGYKEQE